MGHTENIIKNIVTVINVLISSAPVGSNGSLRLPTIRLKEIV